MVALSITLDNSSSSLSDQSRQSNVSSEWLLSGAFADRVVLEVFDGVYGVGKSSPVVRVLLGGV